LAAVFISPTRKLNTKRYEDSSLSYTGINKHEGEDIGLYDTVLSAHDYHTIVENVAEIS